MSGTCNCLHPQPGGCHACNPKPPLLRFDMGNGQTGVQTHVCNCIGCCQKCGQCRTAPWHTSTCQRIAELRSEERRVIEEARRVQSA